MTKRKIRKGSKHWKANLTELQVGFIRKYKKDGWSAKELAEHYAVSEGCIWDIVLYRTWKHVR